MGKKSTSGSGIRSGMNILDHISQTFETIFWVKIPKFFNAQFRDLGDFLTLDPGWKKFGSGIKNSDLGLTSRIRNTYKRNVDRDTRNKKRRERAGKRREKWHNTKKDGGKKTDRRTGRQIRMRIGRTGNFEDQKKKEEKTNKAKKYRITVE
jgi:hypothetical protein